MALSIREGISIADEAEAAVAAPDPTDSGCG